MTLRQLAEGGDAVDLTEASSINTELSPELGELDLAVLASSSDPFDPMEKALHEAGGRLLTGSSYQRPSWSMIREYPLSPELLVMSHAWTTGQGGDVIVAAKGAPEAIAGLCQLSPEARARLLDEVKTFASGGLRVLAVAKARTTNDALPNLHRDLRLSFVGLVGLEDPLRSTVPPAVTECKAAGVRVVMITGDYPATALSIARQAGIATGEQILTGAELARMSDAELAQRVKDVQVFARVVPEQKLRIVNALKAAGDIVAMTGDGVNDAPALKSAHIGIAMGGRGTDVAREAASLVLLDDDFSSIVAAIRLGRRIFDNIKKAIAFILAVHVPIVGLSMIPVFVPHWPLLLFPVHIVFLELIIDPSCSLIFEAEEAEADVMRRPPRRTDERLFAGSTVSVALAQGLTVLAACIGVCLLARQEHVPEAARIDVHDVSRGVSRRDLGQPLLEPFGSVHASEPFGSVHASEPQRRAALGAVRYHRALVRRTLRARGATFTALRADASERSRARPRRGRGVRRVVRAVEVGAAPIKASTPEAVAALKAAELRIGMATG